MKMEINFHAQVSTFNLKLAERFWGDRKEEARQRFRPDVRLFSTIFNYTEHLFIMHIF